MSKEVKTIKITGNKLVDGIILLIIGFALAIGIPLFAYEITGGLPPMDWWKIWGRIAWDIIVPLFYLAILFGIALFSVGLIYVIKAIVEPFAIALEIDKMIILGILLALVYIPTLVSLTYLVVKLILPYPEFLEFLKWILYPILTAIAGYIIGKKTQ